MARMASAAMNSMISVVRETMIRRVRPVATVAAGVGLMTAGSSAT